MSSNKKVVVLGGGTVVHVANHFAIGMMAYGNTARRIAQLHAGGKLDVVTHLTKMAGGASLETNEDVSKLVDDIVADESVKIVYFNVAMSDFVPTKLSSNGEVSRQGFGKYEQRLSSKFEYELSLSPAEKVLKKIRAKRKDIFLVAFKTTCGATENEQYIAGLNLLKQNSCNLVLANDTKTRTNMIITPEEARYHVTTNREQALENLVEMTLLRSHLTFTRSTVVAGIPVAWDSPLIPATLRKVVEHCVARGAYKVFRGATVGHFAFQLSPTQFLTSIRKSNFNDIAKHGLVLIKTDGPDSVIAYGAKPSVGGQSQRIVFSEHPEYNCIVHFHCPIRSGSLVKTVSQREYECGSHECGQNTSNGLTQFGPLSAVYLENHGPNIVFHDSIDPQLVVKFIEENFDLEGKTGGPVY